MMGSPEFPPNLVHILLALKDKDILTSSDGKRIDVSLEAICEALREAAAS